MRDHLTTRRPDLPLVILKVGTLDDPGLFGTPQMAIYAIDKQPSMSFQMACRHLSVCLRADAEGDSALGRRRV